MHRPSVRPSPSPQKAGAISRYGDEGRLAKIKNFQGQREREREGGGDFEKRLRESGSKRWNPRLEEIGLARRRGMFRSVLSEGIPFHFVTHSPAPRSRFDTR